MEEGTQPAPEEKSGQTRSRKVTFAPLPQSHLPKEESNLKPLKSKKPIKEDSDSDSFECDSESSSDENERKKREEEIERAQKEWEAIEEQQKHAGESLPTENGVGGTKIDFSSSITYFDALKYLRDEAKGKVSPTPQVHYTSKNCFCLEKTVQKCSQDAFNEAYKIAKMEFNDSNLTHIRILTSLHVAMTGILTPPPRYGDHWVDIGFQTKDPVSDLRATGMLGLILPLGMFAKFKPFAARLLKIARGDCPFPLMVILIVYVKETLDALPITDILLNSTSRDDAWHNILIYFTGLVATLANEWVKNNLDFEHDYNTFDQIAIRGRSNVSAIMQAGLRAEKEEDVSMPTLKEDIDVPPP